MAKRIVIKELSGLWRIVGVEDALQPRPEWVTFPNGEPPLSLSTVKPRYVLYHEVRLLEAGRFNDFHPSQV